MNPQRSGVRKGKKKKRKNVPNGGEGREASIVDAGRERYSPEQLKGMNCDDTVFVQSIIRVFVLLKAV